MMSSYSVDSWSNQPVPFFDSFHQIIIFLISSSADRDDWTNHDQARVPNHAVRAHLLLRHVDTARLFQVAHASLLLVGSHVRHCHVCGVPEFCSRVQGGTSLGDVDHIDYICNDDVTRLHDKVWHRHSWTGEWSRQRWIQ